MVSVIHNNNEISRITAQTRTVSDLILEYLIQINVDYIFGIPGGAIEPLFDAIARLERREVVQDGEEFKHKVSRSQHRDGIKSIKMVTTRHEAGAAFMADGYARETGKLGVCCATTGPGATNLITGIASAYMDRTPMLVITPQTSLPNFGKHSFQDSSGDSISIVDMFAPCTRYNSFVSHIEQLEGKLFEAIYTAFRHPRGPVHLSIPMDIMAQPIKTKGPLFYVASMLRQFNSYDRQGFGALCKLLQTTENLALFLGEGCLGQSEKIIEFAELTGAQIVTTPSAKGVISAYHPLYRGVFGFAGHDCATQALIDDGVDAVLAIGTTLGEFETSGWCGESILNEKKLVHIDAAQENFARSPMARLHVYGHLGTLFGELVGYITDEDNRECCAHLRMKQITMNIKPSVMPPQIALSDEVMSENKCALSELSLPVKPRHLMVELTQSFPERTRFIVDVGNSWAWATHFLHLKSEGTYRIGMGFGAMGWAIGAAIGTALAERSDPVVCITGDGCYLMNGQEITVAVENKLSIIFVVLNDHAWGMIKHGQMLGGGEQIGYELPHVNYAKMAQAVGARAMIINTAKELFDTDLNALFCDEGPVLLDVRIDPDEVPPMGMRMKSLGRSRES